LTKSRTSFTFIAVLLLVCGAIAEAQQAGKILRIGYLEGGTASGSAVLGKAFLQELTQLGGNMNAIG
jgi:hypothetical protein